MSFNLILNLLNNIKLIFVSGARSRVTTCIRTSAHILSTLDPDSATSVFRVSDSTLTGSVHLCGLLCIRMHRKHRKALRVPDGSAAEHFLTAHRQIMKSTPKGCFSLDGAGRENRTPVSTLGRSHSTTKPYPRLLHLNTPYSTNPVAPKNCCM